MINSPAVSEHLLSHRFAGSDYLFLIIQHIPVYTNNNISRKYFEPWCLKLRIDVIFDTNESKAAKDISRY